MASTTDSTAKSTTLSRRTVIGVAAGAVSAAAFGVSISQAPHASALDLRIRPRSEWDFDGWAKDVANVAHRARTHFVVHWQGPKRGFLKDLFTEDEVKNGPGAPKQMHEQAKDDDGPGIEYSFVITQKGEIWEGRGWDLLAGAVENFNTPAISVQIHIRKGDKPSDEAMRALEWLYFESNRMLSRPGGITKALQITGHQDHYETECPGPDLEAWARNRGPELEREAQADFVAPPFPKPKPPKKARRPFPGANAFRIGKSHPAVLDLDRGLIKHGFTKHNDGNGYQASSTFTEATRRNVQDFQRAQGWRGSGADGYPGPKTWDLLTK